MKRFIVFALSLLVIAYMASAAPKVEERASIVATTSWTAAYAVAAGAEDVYVLAPYEMRHPPEYELSPSDLVQIAEANFVVYAGYEKSVERIQSAVGTGGPELVQIATDFSPQTIETTLARLGRIVGTEEAAAVSTAEILSLYAEWRDEIRELGLSGAAVVAHVFHVPFAKVLGGEVIGTYGPAPLQAKQIATLSALPAQLLIDNYHNDVGQPLRETMHAGTRSGTAEGDDPLPVVEFINFPGVAGTVTLVDVIRENRKRLSEVIEAFK